MSTYQLVRHNRPNKDLPREESDAIERVRDCLRIQDWGPDLIIKAFRDLDTVFFMGRLVGNCLIRWRDREGCERKYNESHFYGLTAPLGPLRNRQVQIILNANLMFFQCANPYKEMWRTILVSALLPIAILQVHSYNPGLEPGRVADLCLISMK